MPEPVDRAQLVAAVLGGEQPHCPARLRRRQLRGVARARQNGHTLAKDDAAPLAIAGTCLLWLLRLVLAPDNPPRVQKEAALLGHRRKVTRSGFSL
jgi:hypothetical protein